MTRWPAAILFAVLGVVLAAPSGWAQSMGPLKVHPDNGRYFSANGFSGSKAIYLAGSHTWSNMQDGDGNGFDFTGYLNLMQANNQNAIRLWTAGTPRAEGENLPAPGWGGSSPWYDQVAPFPYARHATTCCAADGGNKFDLDTYDQAYFDRLRDRVIAARDRGIYVIVLLENYFGAVNAFGGRDAWKYHPYRDVNNVNGVDGDVDNDGNGEELFTDDSSSWLDKQKAFVHKVVDTVNDLDNVLYETCNECGAGSEVAWHNAIIDDLNSYQAGKPKQHPVCFTGIGTQYTDTNLLTDNHGQCTAFGAATYDGASEPWNVDPPSKTGKVVLADSDHFFYMLGRDDAAFTRRWAWKIFLRGYHPLLMEDLGNYSGWLAGRQALGQTRTYADKMTLAQMTPQGGLSNTGYVLAKTGSEYLVLSPTGGGFTLTTVAGTYTYEWFDPVAGLVHSSGSITLTTGTSNFTPPFSGMAVLYLKSTGAPPPPQSSDLLLWWKFDESSGATAADSSSWARTGTVTGGASWVTGVNGNALSFDGVDDYVSGSVAGLPAPNQPQTIALWTNVSSIPSTAKNIVSLTDPTAQSSIEIVFANSQWRVDQFGVGVTGGQILGEATPATGWHHLAYTYDGTTHRFYVDAVQRDSRTVAPQAAAHTVFNVGRWPESTSEFYYAGLLDDLRIYNRALSAAEIAALIGTPPTSVTLTWVDMAHPDQDGVNDEDGFRIQKRSSVTSNQWQDLGTVGMNVTTFTASLAVGETGDCYRVLAFNTAGDSPWTQEACRVPLADLAAPQNLVATLTATSPPTVRLTWSTVPGAVRYRVFLHKDGTPYDPCTAMVVCDTVTSTSRSATIALNTLHDWWVQGEDSQGRPGPSSGNSFTFNGSEVPPGGGGGGGTGQVNIGPPGKLRLALTSVSPLLIRANWDLVPGAAQYRVEVENLTQLGLPCAQMAYCVTVAAPPIFIPSIFRATYRVTIIPLTATAAQGFAASEEVGTPLSVESVRLSLTLLRYGVQTAADGCLALPTCTALDLATMLRGNLITLPE